MRDLPSVRQMRAFVAVYQLGHLSAAAEQLSVTQPAVTVLIRELEARLGVKLFDRTTRSLRRTEAADEAIGFVMRALDEMHQLSRSLSDLSGVRRGRFRVAATSTVAQTLLPSLLRNFLQAHPDVEVSVQDCGPLDFVQTLASDRADVGIGSLEQPVPGLVEHVFLRDELVAAALPGKGFDGQSATMTWRQLVQHPLIVVKPGYGIRRLIDKTLADEGLLEQMQVRQEVALLSTALAMAAADLGVAVVPRSIVTHGAFPSMVTRRLTRPVVERAVALVYRVERSLSPAALAFARSCVPTLEG